MRIKYISAACYLFFCFLLLPGCIATSGVPTVHATRDQNYAFSDKKTWGWYQEKPVTGQVLESGYTDVLDRNMRRLIEEELQEKGLEKVSSNPDLLVAYDVSVSVPLEKDNPAMYAPGFGYSYAYEAGYRYKYGTARIEGFRPVDLFKQGTLLIDLIDPASGQLVWRGVSEGAINDFDAGYKKVKEVVEPVLNNVPVN